MGINIPGDFPGGEMPPGDVNVWVVDWEACYMRPGPETCPTVKVAPGDYVFFKWAQYHDVAYAPSKEAYDMCTDDTDTEAEDDTDTEDEGDTDTEDEGDTDAEDEDEDMESGVFIDPEMSGNATLTIGNITTGA